jgi:hypothetical protein
MVQSLNNENINVLKEKNLDLKLKFSIIINTV